MRKFDRPSPLTLACLLIVLAVPAAHAATHTVCQTAPATFFDIQDAIDDAGTVNGDVIDVCAGAHTEEDILITKDLTFRGQGQGVTFVQAAVTPGTASQAVFEVDDDRTVDFEDMTIRHGRFSGIEIDEDSVVTLTRTTVSDNTAAFFSSGGGIEIDDRNIVTLVDSTVSNNSAAGAGGGIYADRDNVVTLINSTVSNNSAEEDGGGIQVDSGGTQLLLVDTTVSDNSAGRRGGGIMIWRGAHLTLDASTVSGNSSDGDGGGIYVMDRAAEAHLSNSTVSNNSAGDEGGGLYVNTDFRGGGIAVLTNVTVAENEALSGGGIFTPRDGALVTLANTIVAGNSADDCDLFEAPTIPAGAPNLDSDGTCDGFTLQNADADLGPLADNGGATFTHALGAASDALDAGDDAICAAAPVDGVDQRGVGGPQGAHCDLGAYELILDTDGDGVDDPEDACPGTVFDDPAVRLGVNRWALLDDDDPFDFDTTAPRGRGKGPGLSFTTEDTAGCSCAQIIDELDLGKGHEKFGCSISAMREWVAIVSGI